MITANNICRIKGHGYLNISYKDSQVQLIIDEGERLFEHFLIGKKYNDAPFITTRICGTCSTSHTFATINALEKIFAVQPDPGIDNLRKILQMGQIIQSHTLHFFFLALPDYLGLSDFFQIGEKKPEILRLALGLKEAGDDIVQTIGGRQIHPITPCIGGFSRHFKKEDLAALLQRLEHRLILALEGIDLAASLEYPQFSRKTEYFALTNKKDYCLFPGMITSTKKVFTDINNYDLNIKEYVLENSPAKRAKHGPETFMVGALARLNLESKKLQPKTQKAYQEIGGLKDIFNPFLNNLAQTIEIMNFLEETISLLSKLLGSKEVRPTVPYKVRSGEATGAIEAPAGTLYHYYKVDSDGLIVDCDIITPTVQNLANLEENAAELLKQTADLPDKERYRLLEMLVRAYDLCLNDAVH